MTDYINKASDEDSDFSSLVEDVEFKKDLVRFFSGGRYKYSREEMKEKGFDGLTEDFIEHMRYQAWNEATAFSDLNYVNNKDMSRDGKDAFGRLMQAWDHSGSAGTGFLDGVGDFAEAIVTAPSTYVGLGSAGLGKLGAKAAGKATQVIVRKVAADGLKKNLVKSGLTGAASGAVMGAGQAALEGETREEVIEDYNYTNKDLLTDALIGGTVGGALGVASGALDFRKAKKFDEVLTSRQKEVAKRAEEGAKNAKATLAKMGKIDPDIKEKALGIVADIDDIFSARAGDKSSKLKDRLDPARVAKGKALLAAMEDEKSDIVFSNGLSTSTMRNVAAATADVLSLIKEKRGGIGDNERITETVARALREGDVEGMASDLTKIRDTYGLSKDEFSLIYMAEASRAGQILGFQSALKRGLKPKGIESMEDMDVLFTKGVSSLDQDEANKIFAKAVSGQTAVGKGVDFLRDVDATRIAFMTSQPATTARNLRNAGIMVATDVVDEFNKAIYKGLTGDVKAVRDMIPNMTATLRGFTALGGKAEAAVLREVMLEEMPEQSRRLYQSAMRADVALEGHSVLARAGRAVNVFNTASDSVLKEAMFYGAMDRQFRASKAGSLADWLKTNKRLEDLPEGISVEKAISEANRLTMQRDFKGEEAFIPKATRSLSELNRKMPFVISSGLGLPFPRYAGNHLNTVFEYTPVIGEMFYRAGIIAGSDQTPDRLAKQMTGFMAILAGVEAARMRNGEVDYGSIKNEMGAVEDMKPYIGSYLAHMRIGEYIWRSTTDLPNKIEWKNDLEDVLGGIPDFSFDLGFVEDGINALAGKGDPESFYKNLGSFASTFTMPIALARDAVGQFDYDQAGSPWIKDLARSEDLVVGNPGGWAGTVLPQTMRMAPDFEFIQYTQSFNGKTDIDIYDPFNPVARGKVDPLRKQAFGTVAEPPLTDLQKEMSRMGMKPYLVYTNRTVPNAVIDLLVRKNLSQTLYKDFEIWRKKGIASKRTGQTYDEMPDNEAKAEVLKTWLNAKISSEAESTEAMFESVASRTPVKVRGYVRNAYALQSRNKKAKEEFDIKAQGLGFKDADDFISSSETVEEEIGRRRTLLKFAPLLLPNEPL